MYVLTNIIEYCFQILGTNMNQNKIWQKKITDVYKIKTQGNNTNCTKYKFFILWKVSIGIYFSHLKSGKIL